MAANLNQDWSKVGEFDMIVRPIEKKSSEQQEKIRGPEVSDEPLFSDNISLGLIIISVVSATVGGLFGQSAPLVGIVLGSIGGVTLFAFLGKALSGSRKVAQELQNMTQTYIVNKNINYKYDKVLKKLGDAPGLARIGEISSYVGVAATMLTGGVKLHSALISHNCASKQSDSSSALESLGMIGVGASTLIGFVTFNRLGPKLQLLTETQHQLEKCLLKHDSEQLEEKLSIPKKSQ